MARHHRCLLKTGALLAVIPAGLVGCGGSDDGINFAGVYSVESPPSLRWDSPMTREDGSKLYPGEIGGYRVSYRLRHEEDFTSVIVDGPDTNHLRLQGLPPGAYEFTIRTIDTRGLESRRSKRIALDLIQDQAGH